MKFHFIVLVFSLAVVFASSVTAVFAESSLQVENVVNNEKPVCDPIITVNESNKSRFQILKNLADVHGFTITLLESEDIQLSLEKTDKLSRIIESITRDTSVVLRYKMIDECERLTEIAFLDNKAWDAVRTSTPGSRFGSRSRSTSSSRSEGLPVKSVAGRSPDQKRAQLDMTPRPITEEELAEQEAEQTDEQKEEFEERRQARILAQERQEELRKQRMESRGQEYQPAEIINDSIEGGENLNATYRAGRPNWRSNSSDSNQNNDDDDDDGTDEGKDTASGLGIEDMDTYVGEVLAGERMPETGSMNAKERFEYMKARQRTRNE